MTAPKAGDVKKGISVIWENLQCPICLDLMSTPVSTKCDHQFCKFCIIKLLERSKRKEASCPVCKMKVTKRSLQESPGFQRLVEGLQNLIKSYEFDTCTNYFTGMPQKRPEASVETESRDQHGSGENTSPEQDEMVKAQSSSSSAVAKDAFARLMGLEDSCTADPQQDCSDSGLGYLPQDSEKKPAEPENLLSGREGRPSKSQADHGGPDDGTSKSRKRSGLRSQSRVGLEPDRIVDKRQKKSVEKVSEWLMKMPHSSHTQTEDNSAVLSACADSDCEKDTMCSSAPIEVTVKANEKSTVSLPREAPGQGLEKQVFGAVYKRERKPGKTRVSRGYSPVREILTAPFSLNLVEEEKQIKKKKPSCKVTPAKLSSDAEVKNILHDQGENKEPMESAEEDKQENCAGSNSNMLLKCLEENENMKENYTDENCVGAVEDVENSYEFELPVKKLGRRSKVKMKDAWQDVDCDLKVKENKNFNRKDRKRRITRSNSESTNDELDENKNAKYTKPLALVSADTETVDFMQKLTSKPKLTDVEVTIESYPSSAELHSPESRKTRRSLRLQAFAAEVQGIRERRRSIRALPKPDRSADELPKVNDQNTSVDNADANQGKASPLEFRTAYEQCKKKNGCVYNSDIEVIETVHSSDDAAPLKCVTGEITPKENSVVFAVPDTMDLDRQSVPLSATVVSSPDPLVAGLPCSSLPEKYPESLPAVVAPPFVQASTAAAVMPLGVTRCIEEEGDANDSEHDTEQLLKTFKATKRKSFCLGSPMASFSRGQEGILRKNMEDKELLQGQIPATACQNNGPNLGPANISRSDLSLSNLSPSEKSSQMSHVKAGVVSVRCHQATSSALASGSKEHAFLKMSGVSLSPALSPNKVARPSQDSMLAVNSEMAFSFHLFSANVTEKEPEICSDESKDQSPKPGTCLARTPDISQENKGDDLQSKSYLDSNKSLDVPLGSMPNSGVQNNHWESSVTPDGLIPAVDEPLSHPVIESAVTQNLDKMEEQDVDILSQPCLRRKRKAQRLNSSESDLSAEDDDLPTLAELFRSHCAPNPSDKRQKSEFSNQDGGQLKDQRPEPESDSESHLSLPLGKAELEVQSGHVSPNHKQDIPEDVKATTVISAEQDGSVLPQSCRNECITSSQGSVDLFGTPEEAEAADGIAVSNAGLSMDSSQYSSEILNTQQREEMKLELCRLKKMMALVSEALHQKESHAETKPSSDGSDHLPSKQNPGADLSVAAQCKTGKQLDRLSGPRSAPGPACLSQSPGMPRIPQVLLTPSPLTRAQAQTAQSECSRIQPPERQPNHRLTTRSGVGLEGRSHGFVSAGAPVVLEEGQEEGGAYGGTAQTGVCRAGNSNPAGRMELVGSGLTASELGMLKKFVRKMDGSLSKQMTERTTHIIIKTDGDLVCERTLKYFQGIAGRKWVVSFLWIVESFKQGKVLDEAMFEVRGDVVNGHEHNGPRKSRMTPDDNLLMKAYEICFQGSFTDMTTDHMESMVEMCGAVVVRDPLSFTTQSKCQLVVVQPAPDDSQSYYRALQTKATVVTRSWLLDTIATYTLQNPEDYKP